MCRPKWATVRVLAAFDDRGDERGAEQLERPRRWPGVFELGGGADRGAHLAGRDAQTGREDLVAFSDFGLRSVDALRGLRQRRAGEAADHAELGDGLPRVVTRQHRRVEVGGDAFESVRAVANDVNMHRTVQRG